MLGALGALGLAFRAGSQGVALIVSTACAVAVVAWTFLYFRPTIERFLEAGGGNTPAERLQIEAHRWIRLNWIRRAGRNFWVGSPQRHGKARMNPAGGPTWPSALHMSASGL